MCKSWRTIGRIHFDMNHRNISLDTSSRSMEIQRKLNKRELIKLKNMRHCKGNHKQNKETTYKKGEIICQ